MSFNNYYNEFKQFMFKSEVEKAFHTLEGILKGIAIDGVINSSEVEAISSWFDLNRRKLSHHPFSTFVAVLKTALSDGQIDDEERADILWLCSRYTSADNPYYDMVASDIQRLQGILQGIMADNRIEEREIEQLRGWLTENAHLAGVYPYNELCSLIVHFMEDEVLSPEEIQFLKAFFAEFSDLEADLNHAPIELDGLKFSTNTGGICSVNPTISIPNKTFCFTGESSQASRFEVKTRIESLGGRYESALTADTDFLIVGDVESSCWAFSCSGRKVEQAMKMRRAGHHILIVHESDFWSAISGTP